MSKAQNLAGITPNIPFTGFDFYKGIDEISD